VSLSPRGPPRERHTHPGHTESRKGSRVPQVEPGIPSGSSQLTHPLVYGLWRTCSLSESRARGGRDCFSLSPRIHVKMEKRGSGRSNPPPSLPHSAYLPSSGPCLSRESWSNFSPLGQQAPSSAAPAFLPT
jgi:hypothetical protein